VSIHIKNFEKNFQQSIVVLYFDTFLNFHENLMHFKSENFQIVEDDYEFCQMAVSDVVFGSKLAASLTMQVP